MGKRLTRTDTISIADMFVIYKTTDGDYRGASATEAIRFFQENLVFPTPGTGREFTTQYAAPSSTGFNVTIDDGGDGSSDVHLILTPTAGFADGTITLPPLASCVDKQEILVNCTQQVTTLIIDGNGASAVTGEPGAMGADDFFRLKFDDLTNTWYRVG